MATQNVPMCTAADNKEMKREDLLQFLNVFSSEFNNSSLHDRVLVFQVQSKGDGILIEGSVEEEVRKEEKEKDQTVERKQEKKADEVGEKEENEQAGEEIKIEREEQKEEEIEKKVETMKEVHDESKEETEEGETMKKVHDESNEETEEETLKEDEKAREVGIGESNDELEENNNKTKDQHGIACKETSPNKQPNEHKVFVHSCWLAVQSSYFRALFYSGMKESHSKEVVMKIDESELQSHLTLIEAMYKLDILNDKDYSLVLEVLVLADRYDVNFVFKKCKYVLMDTPLTLEKCERILERVKDLPHCDDLLDALTRFFVKEFSPLDKTWTMDKLINLSEASLRLTLSSNDLAVQSENTVFVALMKWIDSNVATTHEQSIQQSSLIRLVRFELMSVDFLYDVVRIHSTASRIPGFSQLLQKALAYHGFSEERRNELKDKPVQRCSYGEAGPAFSWVIDRDVRNELLKGQTAYSECFWYQGYGMVVDLTYKSESKTFDMYLAVQDIKTEGCLNLTWTAKSKLFWNNSLSVNSMYSNGEANWGREVKSKIAFCTVPEDVSHTIDIWVKFM